MLYMQRLLRIYNALLHGERDVTLRSVHIFENVQATHAESSRSARGMHRTLAVATHSVSSTFLY